ncbi:AIM24 family protein [Humitalea sp. 24SJ18S-53]|uniref:AIM24 family protein n=1 Tax=Humitalea sp. 24SJ18S-53 TaxID=3422307 RepID=UPI003D6653C8
MAEFTMMEQEGVRFIHVRLEADTVRIEAGALSTWRGRITMNASIPTVGTMVKSSLSDERSVRPTLTGTGEVVLESSVGGFHIFEMQGEEWILEPGAYWASDDEIRVGAYRERMLNVLFAGDGLIDYCTRVSGQGRVVLTARGPAEEIVLAEGETFAAEAKGVVIARSAGITYRVRRPMRSILRSWISGEKSLRIFTGPGRIIVAPTPYWRAYLLEKLGARAERAHVERPPAPQDSSRAA